MKTIAFYAVIVAFITNFSKCSVKAKPVQDPDTQFLDLSDMNNTCVNGKKGQLQSKTCDRVNCINPCIESGCEKCFDNCGCFGISPHTLFAWKKVPMSCEKKATEVCRDVCVKDMCRTLCRKEYTTICRKLTWLFDTPDI